MKPIKFERRITMYDMRNFCINHDYYTGGTCEEYDEFLRFVDSHEENVTDEFILEAATNIFYHSDFDIVYVDEDIYNIAYEIMNEVVYFVIDEENEF